MRAQQAVWLMALVLSQAGGWSTPAVAQQPADLAALQQSWSGMSAADFMTLAQAAIKQNAADKNLLAAVNAEAARQLTSSTAVAKDTLAVVSQLTTWAKDKLSAEQLKTLRAQLQSRTEIARDLSAADLHLKIGAMKRLGCTKEEAEQPIKDWLSNRDLTLLPTEEVEWCCMELTESRASMNKGLSVKWTGTIRAPRAGQYRFSGSGLRVDGTSGGTSKTAMRVWLDEQPILDTSSETQRSAPVALAADKPATLRIEFDFKHSGERIVHEHPALAMLYWEGEGAQRQLVPASALQPPDKNGQGLLGEYKALRGDGVPDKRVDPQIDFAWTHGCGIILRNPAERQKLVNELVARYTSPEYLAARVDKIKKAERAMLDWRRLTELMSSAQRATIARAVAGHEPLVRQMTDDQMRTVWQLLGPGAEKETLELFGKWMQLNEPVARPAVNFFEENRQRLFHLGQDLVFLYPEGREYIESKVLEQSDGSCCLYAAYALNYAYGFTGKLEDWIKKLDARLANEALTGDRRVNWLLARAQAEEIRGGSPVANMMFPERTLAGMGWLDEASLVAKSEGVKLRILDEKFGRLASIGHRQRVEKLTQDAESRFTSADARAKIGQWKTMLEKLVKQREAEKIKQSKVADAAYVAELKRRQSRAEARDDQAAIARYQVLIDRSTPAPVRK